MKKSDQTLTRRAMLQASCKGGMGLFLFPVAPTLFSASRTPAGKPDASPTLRVVSRTAFETKLRAEAVAPPWYGAFYAERNGNRLLHLQDPIRVSEDNGCSWLETPIKPDFSEGLPYGYRRNTVTSVLDHNTGRIFTLVNSLDTPGLDPKKIEPPVAQFTYYLRYRVSNDGGRSWAFEEPMISEGKFTQQHPFEGIHIGKSAFYIGDRGGIPIVTREGKILVPSQTTAVNADGTAYNPGRALTYTDVLILIGTWKANGRLAWKASRRVKGDPARSVRGMIEPTLVELNDGRILMIMRGSNGHGADPEYNIPGYRWFSISNNGGEDWSDPQPWTYDNGEPFFSPSSMSTLVRHSSGRIFWLGNITSENPKANLPRWPLVMGEVDPTNLRLIRDSILTVDTRTPSDEDQGRLDIIHVTAVEDRATGDFIVTYPRCYHSYKYYQYHQLRIAI